MDPAAAVDKSSLKREEEASVKNFAAENGVGVDTDTGEITSVSNCGGDGEGGGVISSPLFLSVMLDNCKYNYDKYNEDIYVMTNFLVTTVSKTEVSRGQSQVREDYPRLMGYRTDRYKKAANVAPKMKVMTTILSTKEMDVCQATPMSPKKDQASVGSQITAPQISIPDNYLMVTC